MKKLILFIAFIGLTFSANAQSKKAKEKAADATEYVAKAMNLDATHKVFLYKTLLDESEVVKKKLKNAPNKEAKKAIHKQGRNDLKKELSKKFSDADVKKIEKLMREYKKSLKSK